MSIAYSLDGRYNAVLSVCLGGDLTLTKVAVSCVTCDFPLQLQR